MVNRNIKWDKPASHQFHAAIEYIARDSEINAEKVRNDIIIALNRTTKNAERYGPDKYKVKNDGTYRAFEKHRYRISYRIKKSEIHVIRVRHTSMSPRKY